MGTVAESLDNARRDPLRFAIFVAVLGVVFLFAAVPVIAVVIQAMTAEGEVSAAVLWAT
jgi:hypothetical protein